MKNAPRLAATVILLNGILSAVAWADDPASQTPSVSDKLALQDPDGVPLVISHPQKVPASQGQIDEERKRAQQENEDKDWLLRSFEQQQRLRADGQGSGNVDNLYYRIASDKELSKLAGIPTIESPVDPTTAFKTGVTNRGPGALGLRPDPSLSVRVNSPTSIFTPLITPLGAADAAGLHNFYGTGTPQTDVTADTKKAAAEQSSVDLDMPGKVAADSDPLTKERLTFDSAAEDALPDDTSHHDNQVSKVDLPLGTNAEQLQKLTDASLTAPGTVRTVTPSSINVTALQLKMAADPPSPKLAPPSSGRQPIANPFSILDR